MAVPSHNPRDSCCVRVVKWIPVLFILTIVFWSYYAYVIELCFATVENPFKRLVFILGYHSLFILFIWSYWQTVITSSGRVPEPFRLTQADYDRLVHADTEEIQRRMLEEFSRNLPNLNRTVSGSVRYCEKCRHVKPDRTHHCSVCGKCILKMDHHCPWVNNCIGFTNYKYFVLFLGYALLYCVFVAITSFQYFVRFWNGTLEGNGRFHILFLFFVALMFAISLVSLFCYHCYLVLQNRTTLEAFRAPIFHGGPDKLGFHLGVYNNFMEVFGVTTKLWFFPIFTSLGNGYNFPRRKAGEDSEQLLRNEGQSARWEDEDAPYVDFSL